MDNIKTTGTKENKETKEIKELHAVKCNNVECFYCQDKRGEDAWDRKKKLNRCVCDMGMNNEKQFKVNSCDCPSFCERDLIVEFNNLFKVGDEVLIPETMIELRKFGSFHNKGYGKFVITKIDNSKALVWGYQHPVPKHYLPKSGYSRLTSYHFSDLTMNEIYKRCAAIFDNEKRKEKPNC